LASRSTLLYHLISTLPTSSVRVIFTFGRCDICDRRSPLSRQNQWQLPLSVLGSIIATASCTALQSGTSTVSRGHRTRRLASCIRLLSRRVPRLCANSCTGYRSDNGSRTSWRPLKFQGKVKVLSDPTVPLRTASRPSGCQNTSLYYRSTVLPTICVHSLRLLGHSTTLHLKFGTVSGHP